MFSTRNGLYDRARKKFKIQVGRVWQCCSVSLHFTALQAAPCTVAVALTLHTCGSLNDFPLPSQQARGVHMCMLPCSYDSYFCLSTQ